MLVWMETIHRVSAVAGVLCLLCVGVMRVMNMRILKMGVEWTVKINLHVSKHERNLRVWIKHEFAK